MSQKFNEKRIAVAVSLAMAAGFASVASANEFASSVLTGSTSSGVNVPKAATAALTGYSANIISTDGTLNNTLPSGNIALTLDNGAKFASGQTVSFSFISGASVTGAPGAFVYTGYTGSVNTAASNGPTVIVTVTASAGLSTLTIPGVTATGGGTNFNLKVSGITLNTSGSTLDTAINMSIDSASTFGGTGLTTGSSVKLGTAKTSGATASASATVPTVVPNSTFTLASLTVAENILSSVKGATKPSIRLTLPSGINFSTGSNGTGAYPTFVSVGDSATANTLFASGSASGASNVLVLGLYNNSASAATTGAPGSSTATASSYVFSALKAFVPNGQATGDVNVTVEATLDGSSDAYTSLGSVKIGTVASSSTTVAAYSTGSATTQYATLFTGRSYASISGAYTTGVKLTENVAGTLASGGTVTIKMSNAAAPGTATSSGYLFAQSVTGSNGSNDVTVTGLTSASDTFVYTVGTASTTTADSLALPLVNFKVTGASGSQVQAAVTSSTNLTSATVTLANVVDATSASVSGTTPTGIAGATVALPDIVITESAGAALNTGAIGFGSAFASIDSFDITAATAKVLKTDGTDVTTTYLTPTLAKVDGTSAQVAQVSATLAGAASTTTSGPLKIVISGVKAKLGTAASGDVNVTVGGFATGSTLAASIGSDLGAKATSSTLKVAQFVSNVPSVPTATVTGAVTAQTISSAIIPASGDLGKQGSVFVAAIVPNAGVFLLSSAGAWSLYTTAAAAPAYSTGSLAAISSIPVVSVATDLSGLVGTQVYVGYGTGGALSAAGTAWNNMVNNGTYGLSYTVTK